MNQIDWVGATTPGAKTFKDIRTQRPSVAEEKARLCMELGQAIRKVPPKIASESINITREWMAARDAAAKVAGSSRSSIAELSAAINNMRRFEQ